MFNRQPQVYILNAHPVSSFNNNFRINDPNSKPNYQIVQNFDGSLSLQNLGFFEDIGKSFVTINDKIKDTNDKLWKKNLEQTSKDLKNLSNYTDQNGKFLGKEIVSALANVGSSITGGFAGSIKLKESEKPKAQEPKIETPQEKQENAPVQQETDSSHDNQKEKEQDKNDVQTEIEAPISESDFSKAFDKSKELENDDYFEPVNKGPKSSFEPVVKEPRPSMNYYNQNSFEFQRQPQKNTRLMYQINKLLDTYEYTPKQINRQNQILLQLKKQIIYDVISNQASQYILL